MSRKVWNLAEGCSFVDTHKNENKKIIYILLFLLFQV